MPFRRQSKLAAQELREYAVRLLGGQALSVAQLKQKLRGRAANLEDIDPIVASLKEYGALNDRRYAEHFAAIRAGAGTHGRMRVLSDLLQRKVAPKVAEKAVSEAYAEVDETEAIGAWLARKFRNQDLRAKLQEPRQLAAVYRRLRHAGFASGPSIRVLKRFASQAEELEALEDDSAQT
jgi:SOS response regulatory protein OraA/RecX